MLLTVHLYRIYVSIILKIYFAKANTDLCQGTWLDKENQGRISALCYFSQATLSREQPAQLYMAVLGTLRP